MSLPLAAVHYTSGQTAHSRPPHSDAWWQHYAICHAVHLIEPIRLPHFIQHPSAHCSADLICLKLNTAYDAADNLCPRWRLMMHNLQARTATCECIIHTQLWLCLTAPCFLAGPAGPVNFKKKASPRPKLSDVQGSFQQMDVNGKSAQ